MIYEVTIAARTIQQEGFVSLFKKIYAYFDQMSKAVRFSMLKKPHGQPAKDVVGFIFQAAGGLLGPGQLRSEFEGITDYARTAKPRVIVEIGTANGGTLCSWCAVAAPDATIVSIDLPGGIHGGGYAYWRTLIYRQFAQPGQKLHLIRADSHRPETLAQLKSLLPPGGIDFLFLDGDHTYEGVKADFDMYSPLVKKGGFIAFHDICEHPAHVNCHVDQLWEEMRKRFGQQATREFIDKPNQGGFGIGLIQT